MDAQAITNNALANTATAPAPDPAAPPIDERGASEKIASLPRSLATPIPLSLPFGKLPPSSDESDRAFAQIQAMVAAKAPAEGLGAVAQTVIKGVVNALDGAGLVDKFKISIVVKDPTVPIVYYVTTDGRVIANVLGDAGNTGRATTYGVSFNFFDGFGALKLKPAVALELPNGDCILLTGT